MGTVAERGLLESQEFLLKGLHMDLLRLTFSELQYWGSSSKGTRHVEGGTELSGFSKGLEGQLSPRQKYWQRPFFLC